MLVIGPEKYIFFFLQSTLEQNTGHSICTLVVTISKYPLSRQSIINMTCGLSV